MFSQISNLKSQISNLKSQISNLKSQILVFLFKFTENDLERACKNSNDGVRKNLSRSSYSLES